MDKFVELAKKSLRYYLENNTFLDEYSDEFKNNKNGVRIKVSLDDDITSISGSVYPTRKDIGLDIVHEAVSAGIFHMIYMPVSLYNFDDYKLEVFEFTDVLPLDDFKNLGDYDGFLLSFNDDKFYFLKEDYKCNADMFEDALEKANIDSWDIYYMEKFKVIHHK